MTKLNFFFVLLFVALFSSKAYSQANSVELQDGGGSFISSHGSIEEAYNAIPDTITNAYIIEILTAYDGSLEVFPIDMNLKTGHSSVNTITVRPDAGNIGEIVSGASTSGIISINDADFIILDGRPGGTGSSIDLTIYNTSTSGSGSNTIEYNDGATNCILRYCNVKSDISATAGPRNVIFGVSVSNPSGNSENLVEYCILDGSRSGIATAGTSANPNRDNVISNCSIINFGYAGVWWLSNTLSLTVTDCTISSLGHSGNTIVSGFICAPTTDNSKLVIKNNKVINMQAASTSTSLAVRGIYISGSPGLDAEVTIENNFVSLTNDYNNATVIFGIYTTGNTDPHNMNINYNTVLIGGNQTGGIAGRIVSCGIVKQSSNAGVNYTQRNNISINNRTGGNAGVIHGGCAINILNGTLDIDYNCYNATGSSSAGTNSYPVLWDSVGYDDVSSYAAVSGENNARFKSVSFVSDSDLHLDGASIQDPDLSARPISGITTDIDGDTRNSSFPYKGADESTAFSISTLNLTINLEACSPMQDTVTVSIRNSFSPYGLVEMSEEYLNPGGTASVSYAKAVDGVNYYIVVNHRNSIETWSKSGGEMFSAGTLNFDFTTASTQAFGSNLVLVNGEYSIYTGDVNQDGVVDLTDLSLIDNDAFNFVTGYVNTDLNCDNIVDVTDASFADNNSFMFISVVKP